MSEKYCQSVEAPKVCILAVDDMTVNLKMITGLLKHRKIRVDAARSGMEGLALAERKTYDLIFMDHLMPGMDGVEAYIKMKESENYINRNKNTPVIMLTANAVSGGKEQQYLQLGFAGYLSKPVSGDKLENILLKYLPPDKLQEVFPEAGTGKKTAGAEEGPGNSSAKGKPGNGSLKGKPEDSNNIMLLQNLYQAYPQADIALGLAFCGNASDKYRKLLRKFGENTKIEELNESYAEKDAEKYQTIVYGVKSAALSMGLFDLSEEARALEEAAIENNWEFVRANHSSFVLDYQTAVNAILENLS